MDIIKRLACHDEWLSFLSYKREKGHMSKADEEDLVNFIENREYMKVAENLLSGGFFSLPEVTEVNKRFSDKKRTVFTFSREENYVQKLMAYILLDYDYIFPDNLYSFRKNTGVKKAITKIISTKNLPMCYSYKLDISDYFNSVDVSLLLPGLKELFADQENLYNVIENMLTNPYAVKDGEKTEMKKGIMAGCPLSGFLADFYISDLDRHFEKKGILYARYSDDIIVFSEDRGELDESIVCINEYLSAHNLEVNPKKIYLSSPGEEWSFLGFSYKNGEVDISGISKGKLKKKMKRKASALYRWKIRKGANNDRAVAAYIRYFNKKFYDNPVSSELTWSRWYFPLITTSEGLKEMDNYMQQCIRYIATGKNTKAQFNYRYEDMKKQGYRPLVNAYYSYREDLFDKDSGQ